MPMLGGGVHSSRDLGHRLVRTRSDVSARCGWFVGSTSTQWALPHARLGVSRGDAPTLRKRKKKPAQLSLSLLKNASAALWSHSTAEPADVE
jgi:hypothetical protein